MPLAKHRIQADVLQTNIPQTLFSFEEHYSNPVTEQYA